jgi:glutathione synthase/RimK-type ligase-like ATP-grasp enzyme
MKTMIAYHSKSSNTGKLLRQILSCPRKKTQRRAKLDVLIRWGSSEVFNRTTARLELNTAEAVLNASNKLRMMQLLSAANIPMPVFTTELTSIDSVKDTTNNYYIRSRQGEVRYGNDFNPVTDQYASKPIPNKRREYRVHVFNSKIVAIYEKIPNNINEENYERPALFKSHNCHFSLVNPTRSRCNEVGQKIAIDAVNALGLLFGGVDLIRDKDGNFFVCEVNSAPGLNSNNAQRWVVAMKEYINENLPVRP